MATSKKKTTKPVKKQNKALKSSQINDEPAENQSEQSEELQKDALDDFLFNAANYIYVRRKLFIALAVVIAVILSSVYGVFRYVQYRENVRNEELYVIEKIINDREFSKTRQFQEGLPLLNKFLVAYPGTKQSSLALIYRGGLYYSQKSYSEAENDFETVRTALNNDSELYVLASIFLSNVLRDQKKSPQAIKVLRSAQSEKMTDVVLMEIAELYLQTDQKIKAREALDILLKYYPQSPHSTRAKQLLKLL
ncbi:MAG: tetratricopeptide repeat protein [Deltaproteobacteria bacterium]|nr:tetratricopeptide repeat protein [Deltaproteobacteria bacterium]